MTAPPDLNPFYIPHIAREMRRGRNVAEGYARSWGLAHSDLTERVRVHPFYQDAFAMAQGRSVCEEKCLLNLFLIVVNFLGKIGPGSIVEFGSYKGGSAIFMARLAQLALPGTQIYAFDSFAGMPETDPGIDAHVKGNFGDVNFNELQAYIAARKLDNLHLVPGLFHDTLPGMLPRIEPVGLCHVDCDIATAVTYVYETIKPAIVDHGYLVFDDALNASCIGEMEVVEDLVISRDGLRAEQTWPHLVYRVPKRSASFQ